MKIWLDDKRTPPDSSWSCATTAQEAIRLLDAPGQVEFISLDHDLGDRGEPELTGYDVACYIESMAYIDELNAVPLFYSVHTDNPVGREKIEMALKAAKEFLEEEDKPKYLVRKDLE
jgi:hypothetical protein